MLSPVEMLISEPVIEPTKAPSGLLEKMSVTTFLELLARFELMDLFVGIRDETMIGNLVEFRDEVIVIFQNFCL